ncbi:MAG TPA: TM0106 family RecB-like putative nuclease, partial [Candidatus Baltobacteraceae bacterium]|nr:TM0106 family RecB-like putative nuclease [Candidatus Baltobacteraceae bacterium]
LKARFLARDPEIPTYPEPVENCKRCRWNERCVAQRRVDDHLSLVANVRRSQIDKLAEAGITTAAALARSSDAERPKRLERRTFERLRAQARLQVAARADGIPRYEFAQADEGRGFARLPPPDEGDVYFDMEGDPFYDSGVSLEYLFGVAYIEDAEPAFEAFLGHDRQAEKRAFERFVDFVMDRRARYPNLHVYHYAPYEASALKRLAAQHVTREAEIDVFLREGVLVDLFEVVRQGLRASFESYSLKAIEQFYRSARDAGVTSAIGSVVAYERFLETREPGLIETIVAYNRDDCLSTLALHSWLLERKAEAEQQLGVLPWRQNGDKHEAAVEDSESEAVAAQLGGDVDDPAAAAPDDRARWLAAQLLLYHRREAKPAWWAYFDRLERKTFEELVDDRESISELHALDETPEQIKKSLAYAFSFPPQEQRLKEGDVYDPATRARAGKLLSLDPQGATLRLLRGPSLQGVPLPRAICAPGPIRDPKQRDALLRFARAYMADGARTRYRSLRDVLHAGTPRLREVVEGAVLDDGATTPERLAALTLALDDSYLFVQGPPGSGKTYAGARAIVELLRAGRRVGVAATSHKAIHNMLREIERAAAANGFTFRGVKRCSAENADSVYDTTSEFIGNSVDDAYCAGNQDLNLVAGTAWLFASAQMDGALDVLVIDEAGQVALADAIAMGTAARNLVLLGDPMQLAQVSQGHHPGEAGASVLEHLLGDCETVPPERGLFLPHTYRMHGDVCSFVSELSYDGRLRAAAPCELQRVEPRVASAAHLRGSGLRYLPVAHEGNEQSSPEEAAAIAQALDALVEGTFTDCEGRVRPLSQDDVLVVTPYNAQVARIRATLNERGFGRVRVGTVDKFQGQEGVVVFFSMASSRADDLPRGLEFLFNRNRLNVAVSRARALAILVCSPALLETRCTNVDQLRMVNALCRFVEGAA